MTSRYTTILNALKNPVVTQEKKERPLTKQEREIHEIVPRKSELKLLIYWETTINNAIVLNSKVSIENDLKLELYLNNKMKELQKEMNKMGKETWEAAILELKIYTHKIRQSTVSQEDLVELGFEHRISLLPDFKYNDLTGIKYWEYADRLRPYVIMLKKVLDELLNYSPTFTKSAINNNWKDHELNRDINIELLEELVPKYFRTKADASNFYNLLNTNKTTDVIIFSGKQKEFKLVLDTLKQHQSFKVKQIHIYLGSKISIHSPSAEPKLWKDCNPTSVEAIQNNYLSSIIKKLK